MSINKAFIIGNLTSDPERRTTPQGTSVTSFTVAVQRRFKNADGKYDADFINCVAWRATADFVAQYFQKGSRIGIVGSIQTRSYDDKDGNKRYITEVVADEVEFAGGKNNGSGSKKEQDIPQEADDLFGDELAGFEPVDNGELPF